MEDDAPSLPDRSTLMRMATGYLARYAASSGRVRQVLERRIRRWCVAHGKDDPSGPALSAALDDIVTRLEQLGLLDDQAFAAARTRALARKGLPERRIRMMLRGQGLSSDPGDPQADPLDDRAQARRFATRKRLGPFRTGDRAIFRDKDLRSLMRAGFSFSIAVDLVDEAGDHEDDGMSD